MASTDRTIALRLRLLVDQFKRDGSDAKATVDGVGKAAEDATKRGSKGFADLATWVDKNEQHLNTLTTQAGLVGAGLAAAAALAIKKFADFDQSMSNVAATGEDARSNIAALRDAALDAGARTVFSATEAAGAIEELSKAGLSATQILGGGLDGALDLAAAGQLDVADAAQYTSIALAQFRLDGSRASHVADLLAAGAGKATGEVSDMGQALAQGGLVAAQTGLSIEETTGALAAFAKAGLLGSDAGTSLKTMLQRLTPQSKEAQAQFDELGISAYDAQGNFVGLADFAGQLQTKMRDLTPEARNAALSVMFGSDAVRAASVLFDQGAAGIQTWIDAVDDSGYAAEAAQTRLDNLKGDIEALGGAFETALIKFGEGGDSPLRSIVQGATDVVNKISEMPPAAQTATLAIVGGGGLTLLAVAGLGKVTVAAVETVTALQKIGLVSQAGVGRVGALVTAVGRIGGYAAAITAVAAGTGMLVDQLTRGEVVPRANALADALYRMSRDTDIDNLAEQFGNFGTFLGMATVDVEGLGDALAQSFNPSVTDRVASFFDNIPGVTGYMEKLEQRFVGVDQALASMVAGGNIDQARAAFEVIRAEAEAQGISIEDLRAKFPEYVDALVGAKNTADGTADAQEGMRVSTENTTFAVEDQTAALATLVEAQAKLAGIVLSERDAQRNLEAAYDAVTESIKENGTSLDVTTEKGRANQSALDDVARSGWDLIESMQANGATSEQLQSTMQTTRDRFIELAGQFGITSDEAGGLADQLGLIPKNVDTVATFTDNASAQVQAFINRWAGKTVTVQAIMEANPNLTRAQAADSARYTGQAVAQFSGKSGGYTGDGPVDQIAGVVHGKEMVIRADVTARHRPALEHLNRTGQLPAGYRKGGYVDAISALGSQQIPGYDKGGHVTPMTASVPVPTGAAASTRPVVHVTTQSLDGARLVGALDLGNGLTGLIDARVDAGLSQQQRAAGGARQTPGVVR